jgi:bifunctional DNA-binding transcriptional regulator/antitoxin component of YhaV-PrlF toxin-antitoxin module
MAVEVKETTREVTMSTNRQIGFPSEFARHIGAKPGSKLLETLVRLPGGGYGVLVMRPPKSYASLLVAALAPSGKGGAKFLRGLRGEWGRRPSARK